jgi:hypothetical protein
MRSSRNALRIGLLGVITVALVVSLAHNNRPAADRSAAASAPALSSGASVGEAAMRVSIDPETGALVPDHVPVSKADGDLEESLSRSTDGLIEVHHPDGSVSVDLQGRFQNASMARIDSSGKLHTTCVDHADAAQGFCDGKHAAKKPVAEEQ